ncbi:carboxypeptidase-like regulatory domain-containing protein [Puia sp. P3]|uniref:carboxypeptidase-like regulatory domain-containing protein n=1 Tax=Puia sp. P3 TaxID=3423952 RepID=UPI003D67E5CB
MSPPLHPAWPYQKKAAPTPSAVPAQSAFTPSYKRSQEFRSFGDTLHAVAIFPARTFSGKVLDFNNKPLPGATLQLAGRASAVTDNQGYFSIKIDPAKNHDSILRVNVGMVGYEPSSLAFNTLDPRAANGNLIYLKQQSNSLDEVVVIGYGAKRRETRAFVSSPGEEKIDSLWITVAPVCGRQAYLDYLTAGKKTLGADSGVRGTVLVSFDVSKKACFLRSRSNVR